MEYKMPSGKGNFGTNGQVKIVKIENGKVYFYFREQTKDELLEPVKMNPIKEEDCLPVAKVGTWACNLSANKDHLYSLRPITGVFPAKFKSFRAPKDEQPSPKMSGGKFPHLVFRPLFELTRSDVAGMVVEYQWGLSYNFEENPDELGTTRYSKQIDKSIPTQQLNEFMELAGILDRGAIKWQENILPTMQKRALAADKSLLVHVKNGYVETLIPDQTQDFGDREFEDTEVVDEGNGYGKVVSKE